MRVASRQVMAGVALAALTFSATTACGTASSSSTSMPPQRALAQAVAALYDSSGLTLTVKLDASAARLQQLQAAKATRAGQPAGKKPLTDAQAGALAGGSLVVEVKSAKGTLRQSSQDPASHGKGAFSFSANGGGAPHVLEFRYVNQTLYARADVQALGRYSATNLNRLSSALTAAPAGLRDALQALLAGRWLSLPAQALSGLLALGGRPSPAASPAPTGSLPQALTQALTRDVQVSRVSGHDSRGDHLLLTGSTRTLARDLLGALPGQLAGLPGGLGKIFDAATIPDKTVHADAFVQNGALSAVTVDIAQFATGADAAAFGGKPLLVELDLARTADIAAPAQSVPLDLSQILGSLGGLGALKGLGTGHAA